MVLGNFESTLVILLAVPFHTFKSPPLMEVANILTSTSPLFAWGMGVS